MEGDPCCNRAPGKYCKRCQRVLDRMRESRERREETSADTVPLQCTNCETTYRGVGRDKCPECGAQSCRYAGDVEVEYDLTDGEAVVTDGGMITCCPECEHYDINRRNTVPRESERYRCYCCGATFAEPETRRKHGGHGPPHGTARKLLEMDPDDVSGDGGLQADGGSHVWAGPGDEGTPPDVVAWREERDDQ